jgi:electron transfer flavoprotein alpha subunit
MSSSDIFVIAEIHQGAVTDITLELLGGARLLAETTGGKVAAVLLGQDGDRHVAALCAADRILMVEDPHLAAFAPKPYLSVLEKIISVESPRAVLLGSTSVGLDLGPALAARLNLPVVSGCQRIEADGATLKVTASFCGGKMLADVEVDKAPAVLLVLPGSFRPSGETRKAQVEKQSSPVPLEDGAIKLEEMILPDATDVDITREDILVAVGRGIQQQENLELVQELAEALKGQVCASRPIIDQGWLPSTRQVGKSGMTVKPKLYLALGISGAPEHQEGMKGSELIIAVNTDAKAPIFDIAHYGVQMDMLDLIPSLIEACKSRN